MPTMPETTAFVSAQIRHKRMICGSIRRMLVTEGDAGIIITLASPAEIKELFPDATENKFNTGTLRLLKSGHRIFIISATEETWGSICLFYTGPYSFRKCICSDAKLQGLKLNQKGLWRGKERIAGKTEEQIFFCLGIDFIEAKDRGPFLSERRKLENEKRCRDRATASLQSNRGRPIGKATGNVAGKKDRDPNVRREFGFESHAT